MEINITPEAIDQMVKQAVINSSLGKLIDEAVKAAVAGQRNGYRDPPIEEVVKEFIRQQTRAVLNEHYDKQVKDAILVALADKLGADKLGAIAAQVVDRLMKDLNDSRY